MSIGAVPNANPGSSSEDVVRAFGDIYRAHYQLVYRTAYRVTGSRQDAEDVLQTVFMNLLDQEDPAGLIRSPKAYLYRAAINAALNTVRSRKRYNLVDGIEDIESPAPPVGAGPGDVIRRKLLNAIAKLKPKEVEISFFVTSTTIPMPRLQRFWVNREEPSRLPCIGLVPA
jgi:RNA polymerase sigma factor (sigma-70 family)